MGGSQAGSGSIRWYRWHGLPRHLCTTVHATSACPEFCSPADDGSAGTSPDYGSPAIHSTSTNTCTNQHDERCFFRNQHDQRWFFRNSESACLVTQERDNASCKVPRRVQGDEPPPAAFLSTTKFDAASCPDSYYSSVNSFSC